MNTQFQIVLRRLALVGLLATAPAAALAQQPASPEPAAKGGRTYTGGRLHADEATTAAPTTAAPTSAAPSDASAKGITEKGIKKTEEPAAALTAAPPAGAEKGHSEKGIK